MVNCMPRCPKCGDIALEMWKGETGWYWSKPSGENDSRSYHIGGKMRYRCVKGHEWEE